jgi:long-chain acyl-CoA synthetase
MIELVAGGRHIRGTDFHERVLRAVNGLSLLSVHAGDRVAILMRNDLPQLEATLAIQRLGAYPVQLNWHTKPDEIEYLLLDAKPKVLIVHSDLLGECSMVVPQHMHVLGVLPSSSLAAAHGLTPRERTLPPGIAEWEAWLAAQSPSRLPPKPAVESIIYTSGTTGRPKGVHRSQPTSEQVESTERMRATVFGVDAGARVLVPAPLYHTAPNFLALRAVRKAELLALPERFDAEALLRDIERFRITHLYAVPTIFARLLNLAAEIRARYDLSSLRFVLHAGGPCPPSIKRAMIEWWGPIIHEYYGSTEAGPITFVRAHEWLERPGSVGRPVDGVHIEVHDELGRVLGAGEIGELCVRNENYADFTYLNRPQDRAELQRGSLMLTGDLGYRDQDGYYFLCDRKKDLVISGGVNVYPAEVEAVLQQLEGVADSAVFGIPDQEFGEALAAVVEPLPDYSLAGQDIRAFLKTRLPTFKVPRLVEITAALPREASGKIRKRILREPYWREAGRAI